MTKRVKIAELKNKATQIIRDVQLRGHTYIVTKHAVPVAVIRPHFHEDPQLTADGARNIMKQIQSLANRVGKSWPKGMDALRAVWEERR